MRLLLIRQTASFFAPSMGNGVGIIATIAHQAGHHVKVIDNNSHYRYYTEKDFIKIIKSYRPEVIGFSITMMNAYLSYSLLAVLKRYYPEIFYIAGGIHMKHSYIEALDKGFDVVINHEGERVILPLLNQLTGRLKHDFKDHMDAIAGVSFMKDNGEVHAAKYFPVVDNLDALPFVNYDLFNLPDFLKTYREPGVISICCQRGCPFRCTFCSDAFLRKDRRVSSAEYLFNYVQYIYKRYRRKLILINDNNFAYPRSRAIEFCNRVIHSPLHKKVKFSVQTKIETAHDEELLKLFKKAGVVSFALGIERMEPYSKKQISKHTSNERIYETLSLLKKLQLTVRINGILGFPFETTAIVEHERKAFLDFARFTGKISFSILMPQPGTIYYDNYSRAKEWYLNPQIFSLWRSYYATALDVSSLYHLDKNYFLLRKELRDSIKKAFIEFKNLEHAYFLPDSIFSYVAIKIDRILTVLSKALHRISPQIEFAVFTKVKYARYYFGSWFFGNQILDD